MFDLQIAVVPVQGIDRQVECRSRTDVDEHYAVGVAVGHWFDGNRQDWHDRYLVLPPCFAEQVSGYLILPLSLGEQLRRLRCLILTSFSKALGFDRVPNQHQEREQHDDNVDVIPIALLQYHSQPVQRSNDSVDLLSVHDRLSRSFLGQVQDSGKRGPAVRGHQLLTKRRVEKEVSARHMALPN